jgi:hypothetical protein
MWFVYDSEDQFIICETEEEARQLFLDKLDEYENDASGSEWCDSVEDLMWGKVQQTVCLVPHNTVLDEDYPDELITYYESVIVDQ